MWTGKWLSSISERWGVWCCVENEGRRAAYIASACGAEVTGDARWSWCSGRSTAWARAWLCSGSQGERHGRLGTAIGGQEQWCRATFVVMADGHRRPPRRFLVERGPTGVSGHFLESWRGSGRALKARRGWDHPGVIASLRASMHGMASRGGVDTVRSVSCRGAPRPGSAR